MREESPPRRLLRALVTVFLPVLTSSGPAWAQAAYDLGGTSYQQSWDSQAATNGVVR